MTLVFSVIGLIILELLRLTSPQHTNKPPSYLLELPLLRFLWVCVYALFLFFIQGIYQSDYISTVFISFLPLFCFPLVLTYLFPTKAFHSQKSMKSRFIFLLCIAFVLRILMIIASPHPTIDIFTILKEGTQTLLSGVNPYTVIFSQVYPNVVTKLYGYWPVAILLQIPTIILFHDPRVLLILSDMLSALLLYRFTGRNEKGQLLSLMYLFRPNSLFITEQSFMAPLEFLFIFLCVYLLRAASKKKYAHLVIGFLLGLLTGVKFHYALLIPFFLFVADKRKLVLGSALALTIFVMPFVLWDFRAFYENTILSFFELTTKHTNVPVYRSMNLNALQHIFTGKDIPFALSFFLIGGVFSVLMYSLYRLRSLSEQVYRQVWLLSIILFYLFFYLLFQNAFIHYYYVLTGLLLLLIAMRQKASI